MEREDNSQAIYNLVLLKKSKFYTIGSSAEEETIAFDSEYSLFESGS